MNRLGRSRSCSQQGRLPFNPQVLSSHVLRGNIAHSVPIDHRGSTGVFSPWVACVWLRSRGKCLPGVVVTSRGIK